MAIYPNTPYNLTQKHVEYVKQKEWLDAMAPVDEDDFIPRDESLLPQAHTKHLSIRALLINSEVGRSEP